MRKLRATLILVQAVLLALSVGTALRAQTYNHTKVVGQYTFTGNLFTIQGFVDGAHPGRYVTTILNHPSDDKLSEWPTLPFQWSFYGQSVSGYYASENATFFILLHEEGDFDIVHMAGRKSVKMSETIGVENRDGTMGTVVPGSPDIDFPPLTAAADDDEIYHLRYTETRNSAAITAHRVPPIVNSGVPVEIAGTLMNTGSGPIISYDLSYQVDNGQVVKTTVRNVSIAAGSSVEVRHPQDWQAGEAGRMYTLKVWVDNLNGQPGGTAGIETTVFTQLGKGAPKNVLVEQFTGTWCVWCPDGSVQMIKIGKAFSNASLVAIHAGGNDVMVIKEGQAIADFYRPTFPMAMVDRYKFPDAETVPLARSNDGWIKATETRMKASTPVRVSVASNYDQKSRIADITVTADFVDYGYPGEYRIHLYVVEDRVKGWGQGYDQGNAYSYNYSYPGHPYFSQPNLIQGYVHMNVLRAVPAGAGGNAGAIPVRPVPGDSYSYNTKYTLPARRFKEDDIRLIGFVTYENPANPELSQVLNVAEVKLIK